VPPSATGMFFKGQGERTGESNDGQLAMPLKVN
jgi:hypothetical protein